MIGLQIKQSPVLSMFAYDWGIVTDDIARQPAVKNVSTGTGHHRRQP